MSVEALWAVTFGAVNGETLVNRSGGIVVLESNRIFGGDTWAHYTGKYFLQGSQMDIQLNVGVHFTDGGQSIFGGPLQPYSLAGQAIVNTDHTEMSATLFPTGLNGVSLVAVLKRVAELP